MCASEKSTLALKPRTDTTRSHNRSISGAMEKDLGAPSLFLKKAKKSKNNHMILGMIEGLH